MKNISYSEFQNQISYPVIALAMDRSITVFKNTNELTSCNAIGFKNRYYDGLRIYDSSGHVYTVGKAEHNEKLPLYKLALIRAFNLTVEVSFLAITSSVYQLSDLIDELCKQIDKDCDFWESGGDVNELIDQVRKAPSLIEIINIF